MRVLKLVFAALLLLSFYFSPAAADGSGRIYGKITTVDGDEFEGMIRWDANEGSWTDYLNGNKELPRNHKRSRRRYRDRQKKIRIFGIPIGYSSSYDYSSGAAQSGIRFGHLKTLEVIDNNAVELLLKSGEKIELENGSTDIGTSIRDIVIEDMNEGEIGFDWDDIEKVDFMQGSASLVSAFGERLYGTVTTRHNDEFTGWICWDIDEIFTSDIIDGKEKSRNRKIAFGKILAIERRNSSSSTIYLKKGDEMVLRGTNDVDDTNRGIVVTDLSIGEVIIRWDDFERLELKTPPMSATYDMFDGGRRLEGTVYTEDGDEYTGKIRWDDDEEYTWELLDGDYRDIEFNVEFGNIAEIERKGSRSAIIVLRDGRSFRLSGSNDVDDDNKGIFIELADGGEEELEWDEFEKVIFNKR